MKRKLTALERQLRTYIQSLDFGNDCTCKSSDDGKRIIGQRNCLEESRNRKRERMLKAIAKIEAPQ